MMAAVNPCGFPMLPAYLGLFVGPTRHYFPLRRGGPTAQAPRVHFLRPKRWRRRSSSFRSAGPVESASKITAGGG